uniref:Expressed protein n=1 Tax=Echinococcus granulosus TaxID=6210 RepID=A0A068WFN3_ECHGR|nr:expressed protein [Echinococcus granulosus]
MASQVIQSEILTDHVNSYWHPIFRRRIGGLSFSSNLLSALLLCGATVLRATFTMKNAPCELNSIGFQDVFSFYSSPNDEEKRKFVGTLNKCVTVDSVAILYCCLGLIVLSFLCSLFQLFANLNVNLGFMKKFYRRGLLDVCCVFINCVCLGLMYWAASSITHFQFQLIKHQLAVPDGCFLNFLFRWILLRPLGRARLTCLLCYANVFTISICFKEASIKANRASESFSRTDVNLSITGLPLLTPLFVCCLIIPLKTHRLPPIGLSTTDILLLSLPKQDNLFCIF